MLDRRPVRPTAAGRVLLDGEAKVRRALAVADAELKALDAGDYGSYGLARSSPLGRALYLPRSRGSGLSTRICESPSLSRRPAKAMPLCCGGHGPSDHLRLRHPPAAATGRSGSPPVVPDPVKIVLPADHPLAGQRVVHLGEVDPADWIRTPVIPQDLTLVLR